MRLYAVWMLATQSIVRNLTSHLWDLGNMNLVTIIISFTMNQRWKKQTNAGNIENWNFGGSREPELPCQCGTTNTFNEDWGIVRPSEMDCVMASIGTNDIWNLQAVCESCFTDPLFRERKSRYLLPWLMESRSPWKIEELIFFLAGLPNSLQR